MTRYQIQLLRYIELRPGLSPRCMGLRKRELSPLNKAGFLIFNIDEYGGKSLKLSQKGKEFLTSIGAHTYGNPEWDDEVFMGMMLRQSLHGSQDED